MVLLLAFGSEVFVFISFGKKTIKKNKKRTKKEQKNEKQREKEKKKKKSKVCIEKY